MYKERKETTHGEIGGKIYIKIYKPNIRTMYVKWSQELNVQIVCKTP